ncbi:MAG TPA: enoyl-CoA hydratase-related protein, partial [Acidimicrobiales bacterium]|nr:enoyl-CoA hydratase-related protein [Acidimicrobiales bacterium]
MPGSAAPAPDLGGPLTTTIDDGVAILRFDDGKVNVLSHAAIDAFELALDRAAAEARAVCIVGREGKLSAGFDLAIMTGEPDGAVRLVSRGAELLMRLYVHPQPVVVAVTGHALAAGALLVLACDVRIGADVPAKIGLNETSIGMPLPQFAAE